MPLLKTKQLSRNYGQLCAVDRIDLELQQGEILGLLGPNGAGKSTTMNMLCGVLAPSTGSIHINSIDLFENPKQAKQQIGYLPEHPPLYPELTVNEYLRFCGKLHHMNKTDLNKAITNTLPRCGLCDYGDRLIANLSKGYQQRVGIAQAILHSPPVIILDEPTVGLDPKQMIEVRALIKELGKDHAVVLSTHILSEVQAVCNRVQIIDQGKLIFNHTIDSLDQHLKTNALILKFQQAPDNTLLQKIDGITAVTSLSQDRIRIEYDNRHNPTQKILSASLQQHWELLEIIPETRSLEQVFLELTGQNR